jgi:hypothetical protein
MQRWLAVVVVVGACTELAPPPPAMPWITGFDVAAATDGSAPAEPRAARLVAPDAYGALGVRADVTGDGSAELVATSARGELVIGDTDGHVLARSPGPPPQGTADDVVGLAVGDGQLGGSPLVVVAVQRGGHRINEVSADVYRLTTGRGLERVFAAPVERRDGDAVERGAVIFAPHALIYRAPGARSPTTWVFDDALGRYVQRGT